MSDSEKDPNNTARVTITEVFPPFPDYMEHVHNLVQDAQASGALVQIITIWPLHVQESDREGNVTARSCKPRDSGCPKNAM